MEKHLDRKKVTIQVYLEFLKANWIEFVLAITIYILLGLALYKHQYLPYMIAVLSVSITNNLLVFHTHNKSLLILREGYEKGSGIINLNDDTEQELRRSVVRATVLHRLGGTTCFLAILLWITYSWIIGVAVLTIFLIHSIIWNRTKMRRDKAYVSHLDAAYRKQ